MAQRQDASTGAMVDAPAAAVPTESAGKPIMQIKVYSPFQVFFDESAYSISGLNDTGPFDILPHHHNFITLLKVGELVIQTLHGEQRIRISGGIMHVKADKVIVFLDV